MEAHDSFFDDGGQREPVKKVVYFIENRVVFSRVLAQSVAALLGKPEGVVDPLVLVVASEQMNLLRESNLEGHEQADGLEGVVTSVHVITEEQIIIRFDVTVFIRGAPEVEESHQILVLTVDVAKHLHGSVHTKDHRLGFKDLCCLVGQSQDVLASESKVSLTFEGSRPLLGAQKMVKEQLMQRLNALAVLVSLVAASEVDDLRGLSLLVLDFSLAHSDLHLGFGQALHRRSGSSAVAASRSTLVITLRSAV
mmetsp:Transcript_762/g.946  ORF Transcript_762/g.946 Transcript_762/m.946 type:complete len:252 (+) Transcript_762:356-1111(+)